MCVKGKSVSPFLNAFNYDLANFFVSGALSNLHLVLRLSLSIEIVVLAAVYRLSSESLLFLHNAEGFCMWRIECKNSLFH